MAASGAAVSGLSETRASLADGRWDGIIADHWSLTRVATATSVSVYFGISETSKNTRFI